MSRYIAKKVKLATMEECKQPGCGCFTQNGYYIQYRNGNVDSILFVCDSCYEEKFKAKCMAGDFDEAQYIVRDNKTRYHPVDPLLRNLICWTRKTARTLRIGLTAVVLILLTAFCLKEHPSVRTEFAVPQVHAEINTDVHFAVHDFGQMGSRTETISNQLTRVFTHGGKKNDQ